VTGPKKKISPFFVFFGEKKLNKFESLLIFGKTNGCSVFFIAKKREMNIFLFAAKQIFYD
jgi:hypothetical protein